MECFGLYEDLSLFSGDLLVGINPLADEHPGLEQGGGFQEVTKIQSHVDLFSDEPIKPSSSDPQETWMDKKMDLIKLLSDSNVQITIKHDEPSSNIVDTSSSEVIDINSLLSPALEVDYEVLQPVEPVKTEEVSREMLLLNMTELLSSELNDPAQHASSDISFSGLGDELGDFSTDGLASLLSEEDINALSAPILSPVSPQDVESILSSGPSSPDSTASINDAVVPQMTTVNDSVLFTQLDLNIASVEEYSIPKSSPGPIRSVRASRMKKYDPYKDFEVEIGHKSPTKCSRSSKGGDRKERKKQQNKDAALRYRQKKKQEQSGVFDECDVLEKTNQDLKDKVESMTREIQYLKDLLLEVYKAKGIQPTGLLCK